MKKHLFFFATLVVLGCTIAACGNNGSTKNGSGKENVAAADSDSIENASKMAFLNDFYKTYYFRPNAIGEFNADKEYEAIKLLTRKAKVDLMRLTGMEDSDGNMVAGLYGLVMPDGLDAEVKSYKIEPLPTKGKFLVTIFYEPAADYKLILEVVKQDGKYLINKFGEMDATTEQYIRSQGKK